MMDKHYKDWDKVLQLDNYNFCIELGLTMEEAMEFKNKVEVKMNKEYDQKINRYFVNYSQKLLNRFMNRPF